MLSGIRMREWWRLLRRTGFSIDPAYLPRAVIVTAASIVNSCAGALERMAYGTAIQQTKVSAPIFVLGAPRSGTTFLHNVISQDERFAWPTFYEVHFPWIFLLTERLVGPPH
jgi:hypothetical protein